MTTISTLWLILSTLTGVGAGYGLRLYIIRRSIKSKEAQIQSLQLKFEKKNRKLKKRA